MQIKTDIAKILGNIAFAQGVKCAPCLDREFMDTLAGRQTGDPRTVPQMNAWIAGWTEANLASVL